MKMRGKCNCICSTCTPLAILDAAGNAVSVYRYCSIKTRTIGFGQVKRHLKDGQRIVFDCPDRKCE